MSVLSLGGKNMRGPGCGVLDHDSDCLCDVHIQQRSVVKITELADLPFVQGTVERLGVGVPWTSQDLESVMRIVLHAHDLKQKRLAALNAPRRVVVVDGERGQLLKLHASGLTISEAMSAMQLSFEAWRDLLLPGRNNPLQRLGFDDWLEIERRVRACELSGRALASEIGVPKKTMMDALHWLGLKDFIHARVRDSRGPSHLEQNERDQMKAWIREGRTPTEIVTLMFEQFGVEIARSLVSHTRTRMAAKGDL